VELNSNIITCEIRLASDRSRNIYSTMLRRHAIGYYHYYQLINADILREAYDVRI